MGFSTNLSAMLTLVVALAQLPLVMGGAWHMDMLTTLVNERLDPVVSPNVLGSHMHKVFGGSAFAANYNYDDQMKSSCTSTSLSIDKSNYWSPNLYWVTKDTYGADGQHSFIPIPATARFYYFLDPEVTTNRITAFPPGFRVLAGDPNNKNPQSWINYGCIGGNAQRGDFNFPQACPGGIQSNINFPQCWDGLNLYKSDNSHVKYGNSITGGYCPYSHPIKLPAIMLEVNWQTDKILQNAATQVVAGNLAWANGDTTGYGIHADFTNAWDLSILQAALDNPKCNNASMSIQDCENFKPYYQTIQTQQACSQPDRGVVYEEFGNDDSVAVPKLPGCNPLWSTGAKPVCTGNNANLATTSPSISAFTGTQQTEIYTSLPPTYQGNTNGAWVDLGCLSGQGAFANGIQYVDGKTMTQRSCQSFCGGQQYNFAALSESYCYCGKTLDPSLLLRNGCNTPCSGNTSQTCGIAYSAEVFYNSAPSAAVAAWPDYVGCYKDTTAHNLADFFFQSSSMTPALCQQGCAEVSPNSDIAGAQYGNQCRCGTTAQLTQGAILPDSQCTNPCAGNSSRVCGSFLEYSAYTVTADARAAAAAVLPSVQDPTWMGCYDAGYQNQAFTAYTQNGALVSVDQCRTLCTQAGYSLMALVNGNSCKCDNSFKAPVVKQPYFQCNNPCAANPSQTCGGNQMTAVYNLTLANTIGESSNYLGCFSDSSNPRTLPSGYYYTNSLTVEQCSVSCKAQGYAYAGMESNQCWCGSTLNRNLVKPESECSTSCPGNSTQTCGGYYRLSVYDTKDVVTPSYPAGYLGCYQESSGTTLLNSYRIATAYTDADYCVDRCKGLGYGLAGTMGTMCACSNAFSLGGGGGTRIGDPLCSTPCPGLSTEFCGWKPSSGNSYYSVYATNRTGPYDSPGTPPVSSVTSSSTSSVSTSTTAAVSTTAASSTSATTSASSAAPTPTGPTYGGFVYQGCIKDGTPRSLNSTYTSLGSMTLELCSQICNGQKYFGTQYGSQCFCSNVLAVNTASTNCNMKCPGNLNQICGGSYALSLYKQPDTVIPSSSTTATSPNTSGACSAPVTVTVTVTASNTQPAKRDTFSPLVGGNRRRGGARPLRRED